MRLFVRVYIEASFLGLLVSVILWGPLSDDVSETKVIIFVNLSLTQHAVKIYLSRATGWQFSQALNGNCWDNVKDNSYYYYYFFTVWIKY